MVKQLINRGATPNDGTGDNLRDGADKLNDNFDEIYSAIGDGSTIDASIKLQDESSTQISIPANGGVLRIAGGTGIDTIVSGSNDLTIQVDGTVLSATQVSTLENKSIALGDNTITGTTAEFNTALTDDDFATLTNSVILENKTIDGTQNTLQNIPNSALDSIANSALTNSTFTLLDDTSTADTIALGETFRFTGGTGITSSIGSNEITFGIDNTVATLSGSQELTNKTINASSNTITNITTTELSASANIANTQLANYQITFGADTLALGDTTSTITNLNLDGTSSLSGTGTVDTTGSANKIRFNHAYANVGALESAIPSATYSGMFAYNTTTSNAYVADPGGWSEIVTENSSIGLLSNVDITTNPPTNGQALLFDNATGIFKPGNVAASASLSYSDDSSTAGSIDLTNDTLGFLGGDGISTTIDAGNRTISIARDRTNISTDKSNTGDGSTQAFTINSGRNVDDILVFVNGICLVPTDDYTVSGTTLTFQVAPAASAEIVIRYLG